MKDVNVDKHVVIALFAVFLGSDIFGDNQNGNKT